MYMYTTLYYTAFMQCIEEQLSEARKQLADNEHRLELAERSKVSFMFMCMYLLYMYMYILCRRHYRELMMMWRFVWLVHDKR